MEILCRLKGNEPLLLDDPKKVWVILSGSVALFATKVKENLPEGERRYLFSAGAGEALFGAALDGGAQRESGTEIGILAVAVEATELSQVSMADLAAQGAAGEAGALALLRGWVRHLGETGCWEYPEANSQGNLLLKEPVSAAEVPAFLAGSHADFFRYLNWLEREETEAAFRRFVERERVNRQAVSGALLQLATALQPLPVEPPVQEGAPLLAAAGAVGRALGIEVRPPAQSEDWSELREPVEAIARASQFRTRRVTLEDGWWRQECGPLLGSIAADSRPVALLPAGRGYVLLDPASGQKVPVGEAEAATLGRNAYMFYRPLPKVADKPVGLLQFGIRGYEKDAAGILAIGAAGSLLGMVVPQATAILVDSAIPDSDRGMLWQLGLALFAIAFGQSAFQMSRGILSLRVENAADSALQPAIWDRLLRLSPGFFRQYSSGDLLSRTMSASAIRQKLSGATQRTLLSGVFALLNLFLMFAYSWQLAFVGVGVSVLAVLVTGVSGVLAIRQSRQQLDLDGAINGLAVQLINGVAKLRVAMAEGRAFAAWANKYSERVRLEVSLQRINDAVAIFTEALPLVTSAVLYWVGVQSVEMSQQGGGGLTSGEFLAFNSALGIFLSGAIDLSNTAIGLLGIVPLWKRTLPILQAEPESDSAKANPGALGGRVALDRVSFRYQKDGPAVLDGVSLRAEPGEFVAIVGPSGSGKSTILRLLLGFETPESGGVFYDGKNLAELDLVAVRRQLGVVLQNGRIGAGSIFENIAAGGLVSREEAWVAAHMAGFAEDIQQMPMGLHTVVSEGGTNLSGGQRQRLLIARALVNKPRVIFLDEATSSLDNRTQAIVTESLSRLNATRIAIAHRLSTIRNADRIYVIEAGRVVQAGSFEELVRQEGLFAQLVARQME